MKIVVYIIFFVVGLIFGSFFNVVGYRLSNNMSLIKPRSNCPKCKHVLSWYELIPIISFLIQKGKCKNCGKKISFQYPAVELLTGILFALSYHICGFGYDLFITIMLSSLLMIVVVSDFNYYIIPDQVLIFFGSVIGIANFINYGFITGSRLLVSGILMFLLMYFFMRLGNVMFKKESLGGGDIKLMFVLGLCFNPFLSLISLFLASFIALFVSLIIYKVNKSKIIPFGPFLILGTLVVYYFPVDISNLGMWWK